MFLRVTEKVVALVVYAAIFLFAFGVVASFVAFVFGAPWAGLVLGLLTGWLCVWFARGLWRDLMRDPRE